MDIQDLQDAKDILINLILLIGCMILLIQLSLPSKEARKQSAIEKKRKRDMDSGYKKCMDSVKNMKDEDTKSRV